MCMYISVCTIVYMCMYHSVYIIVYILWYNRSYSYPILHDIVNIVNSKNLSLIMPLLILELEYTDTNTDTNPV